MKVSFLHEPELEFGSGGTHVDIRYGLIGYGPLAIGEPTSPAQLKVGVVGTEETTAAIREWFDRCKDCVSAKQSRLGNLFAPFSGFSENSIFQSSLVLP
jgi:hypothetical protein